MGLAFTLDSCLQAVVIVEYNILASMCGYLPYQNRVNLWSQKYAVVMNGT